VWHCCLTIVIAGQNCVMKIYYDDKIKKDKMGTERNTYGGSEKFVKKFGVKSEGKTTLGRRRIIREDNIKTYFKEIGRRV
jgi:hypothetical protein